MPANPSAEKTPICFWIPWVAPSGNATSGVKAKIAAWKACRRAFDTALRSSPCADVWLTRTITSGPGPSLLQIALQNGSVSHPIQTQE